MTTKQKTKASGAAKKIADATQKISDAAGELSRLRAETAQAVETARTAASGAPPAFNAWKWALILLLAFWCLSGVKGCVSTIQQRFADWKQSVIQRLIPTPPNPFERKTRPDNDDSDGGGIRWKFIRGVEGARSLASWVRQNVPAGADPKTVYDVADAFYDAADVIRAEPEFDEPAEAVAAVRGRLYGAADSAWVPFLTGLDSQANTYGVKSIGDVCELYYAVAGALYDAAPAARSAPEPLEAVSAVSEPSAEPEPGQEPPSDPAALPEPAEPDAAETAEPETPAKECPSGQCPNQAPRTGYGYGYNYGWRWY